MNMLKAIALAIITVTATFAGPSVSFTLRVTDPASQVYHIEMRGTGFAEMTIDVKMPAWTPGYYQILNYAQYVSDFQALDNNRQPLAWTKTNTNTWQISGVADGNFTITYRYKATIGFVAQNLLDAEHGYIMPAGLFMHVDQYLNLPVTLKIHNYPGWTVATGLDHTGDNVFIAPDVDTFYDCPILLGKLESLPAFEVNGIPHYFIGYKLGIFDKQQFVNDLQKIVVAASAIIGHIPYKHYTFLAIGPVPGGIEHLNSTGVGFTSDGFDQRPKLIRMYNFLAHEYFHHYNVKRIRPIELGPFDYDKGSRTSMLWLSEGFTNYYDELIVKRAGLVSRDEYLQAIQNRISTFENKPGKSFQTAAQASSETWTDGPFGRTGDDAYKTISVYEKGSLMGLMLDLGIRHYTQNNKSLDDLMRYLYQEYYQNKKRGFTEAEFKQAVAHIGGRDLDYFSDYINTLKPIDYAKHLAYAGLQLTESTRELPDPYAGLITQQRNDSLIVSRVEWQSPAWNAGLRSKDVILKINNAQASKDILAEAIRQNNNIAMEVLRQAKVQNVSFKPVYKKEKVFSLSIMEKSTPQEQTLLKNWLKE